MTQSRTTTDLQATRRRFLFAREQGAAQGSVESYLALRNWRALPWHAYLGATTLRRADPED